MDSIIELKNISFSYHRPDSEIKALSDISFSIDQGEFVSVVGPSGCGKTTILSILSGLQKQEWGKLILKENISFGYMFQQDLLLSYATIWKNVTLGPSIHRNLTFDKKCELENLLQKYGLYPFKDKYPSQLSGGMRQRAALIRTLALNPQVLLLDEPFSALDYQTRLFVADDIGRIIRKEHKTALLVTHDLAEAICLSDKIIVLSQRPATVIDIIKIKIPNKEKGSLYIREQKEFSEYFQYLWKELNMENDKRT